MMDLTVPQVAVTAAHVSRHGCWQEAIEDVCAATGAARGDTWLRTDGDQAFIYDGHPTRAPQPIAWITSPAQYQAARSRGDLEDVPAFLSRRAGVQPPTRLCPAIEQLMKTPTLTRAKSTSQKPARESNIISLATGQPEKPKSITFLVVQQVVWKAKRYRANQILEAPADHDDRKLNLYVRQGWIRALTQEELASDARQSGASSTAAEAKPGAALKSIAPVNQVQMLDLDAIRPDPTQPRQNFEAGKMAELVASIKATGLEQAILVRPRPSASEVRWYEIVYGERRYRACKEAGFKQIPAKVRDLSDVDAAEKQGIENLDRADLLPLEEARQFRKLLDLPGYGMERLMQVTGLAKNTIYSRMQLLRLPAKGQEAVARGDLPAVTAERLGRKEGRVQELALAAILNAPEHRRAEGSKVPSDRTCQLIIEEVEAKEQVRVTWEKACEQATKEGVTPLSEKEAESEMTYREDGTSSSAKYVSAAQPCYQHPTGTPKWGKVLGKHMAEVPKYLGRDRAGNGCVWMLASDAFKKAKEIGIKLREPGGSGSTSTASYKAQEAARRKAEKVQKERENADLAQIVATVEGRHAGNLPLAFWQELASTIAADAWSDATRRVSGRREPGKKQRDRDELSKQARTMTEREALALLVEIVTVGMRGSGGLGKKLVAMQAALGIKKHPPEESSTDWNGEGDEPSASARTGEKEVEATEP